MKLVDKDTFIQMFESGQEGVLSYEFVGEPEIRVVNEDLAIAAYKVRSVLKVGDKEYNMEAVNTSTWVKRDGKWVCPLHTEAELKNENEIEKKQAA